MRDDASDVIVVGGGPAGCSAALTLAATGARVTLYEKAATFRDKPCGDALTPEALALLGNCGIDGEQLLALGGVRTTSALCLLNGERRVPVDAELMIVRRAQLDQRLRHQVSTVCTVEHEVRVLSADPLGPLDTPKASHRTGFTVTVQRSGRCHTMTCAGLVIATGASGILAGRLGVAGAPRTGVAISQYVVGRGEYPVFDARGLGPGAYWWEFPASPTELNIGLGALDVNTARPLPGTFRERAHKSERQACGPARAGAIAAWSGAGVRWHHAAGAVSCGDAAGLVDPFWGEGISAALLSGKRAGQAMEAFLRSRDHASLEQYTADIKRTFSARYAFSLRMQWDDVWWASERLASRAAGTRGADPVG